MRFQFVRHHSSNIPHEGESHSRFNNSCPFIFSRRQFRKEQVRRLARLKRTRGHNSPPFPSLPFLRATFPRPKIAVRLRVQGRGVHAQTYPYANFERYLLRADADRRVAFNFLYPVHALSKKRLGRNGHTCSRRRCTESILWLRNIVASVASVHHHSLFFPPFFRLLPLLLSLSLLLLLPCVSHPTHLRPHDALLSRHVPSALKRSIEAVYRILQKKTLPLATRRVEKELLPIKKARTRFFFFFERPCSRPRGVNAFYGPRIQWLPPTIPLHLQ